MPPKDKYFNRHAAEARERDDLKQSSERAAKAKASEDAKWAEDDKKVLKKAALANDQAAKEAEAERRRQEKLQQLQDEEREMSRSKVPTKVTKKAMQRDVAKLVSNYNVAFAAVRGGAAEEDNNAPLPKGNVNANTGSNNDDHHVVASGVDASLDVLGGGRRGGGGGSRLHMPSSIADRHIGRRARVQFKLFQQDNLSKLKEEKPNLRISQYNDLLWERWQKSPLNPFVQRAEARASEAVERERNWMFANDSEVSDTEE